LIVGVGTDICDVRRIQAALDRWGERFAQRVLTPRELATFRQRSARVPARGVRFLATRFAAKEAFSKAVGLGMRLPMTWRRCEVTRAPSGAPGIALHGELAPWFEQRGWRALLSVSDESDYAVAFVVVEQAAPAAPATVTMAV